MDEVGTRGVSAIQVQVTELVKDVTELKAKLESHELAHLVDARQRTLDRRETRRYALTTTIATIATLVAVVALLASHFH